MRLCNFPGMIPMVAVAVMLCAGCGGGGGGGSGGGTPDPVTPTTPATPTPTPPLPSTTWSIDQTAVEVVTVTPSAVNIVVDGNAGGEISTLSDGHTYRLILPWAMTPGSAVEIGIQTTASGAQPVLSGFSLQEPAGTTL